jgi:hypothetical protein
VKILLHTAHNTETLAANASRYGVFRIVEKTDGRNLLAVIRELDSQQQEENV